MAEPSSRPSRIQQNRRLLLICLYLSFGMCLMFAAGALLLALIRLISNSTGEVASDGLLLSNQLTENTIVERMSTDTDIMSTFGSEKQLKRTTKESMILKNLLTTAKSNLKPILKRASKFLKLEPSTTTVALYSTVYNL